MRNNRKHMSNKEAHLNEFKQIISRKTTNGDCSKFATNKDYKLKTKSEIYNQYKKRMFLGFE